MVEGEGTPPQGTGGGQPRVVKKVVKKTVVRPASGVSAPSTTRPQAPRATAASRLGRSASRNRPASGTATTTSVPSPPTPTVRSPRATVDVGARLTAARDRARVIAGGSAGTLRRGATGARDRGADVFWAVRDYRLPILAPMPATAITGLVSGLVVVLGGWLAGLFFGWARGTSAGGGTWGLLAVLLVAALAFEVGSRVLTAFGVPHARATVGLSFALVAVVVMLAFLQAVDGAWAWLIVPGLATITLPLVHLLVDLAENTPADA